MRPITKLVLLLSLLVLVTGCRGCSRDKEKVAEEEKRKKKLRLVAGELHTLPFSKELVGNSVKPGHWYQTRQTLRANQNDESLTATLYQMDRSERPTTVWPQGIPLQFERDISLAKGQEKTVEMKVLQTKPPLESQSLYDTGESSKLSFLMRYAQRGLGAPIETENFFPKILKPYQYDTLVLSRNPSRHIFWRGLDCIVWPLYEREMKFKVTPHRIIEIPEEQMAESIPNQLMTMTSISHMVINDVSLNILPQDQLDAILDWLHFGGTIIINGPEAIAGIESSVLKEYAPLQKTTSSELSEKLINQLNDSETWNLRFARSDLRVPIKPGEAIPILDGQLGTDSTWIPSLEGLVAERLVGQGRIVMTSFPMNHSAFVNWPSYSALIHNAILRKPSRYVKFGDELKLLYHGNNEGHEDHLGFNTRLRLWARDLDSSTQKKSQTIEPKGDSAEKTTSYGAWNDASIVSESANNYLKKLSGISVPSLSTILKCLLAYLTVLVPINWLFFRLIRRLELAWVAAPLIALVGVFAIAKAVQLDVGFSRSQTTVRLVELHNQYPRGLLSSYHALYTSLTTNYKVVYPEGQGVVSPMPKHLQRVSNSRGGLLSYRIADQNGSGFQSFPVLSNTTGLVQSEEVVSLAGAVTWQVDESARTFQVTNQSGAGLRDVVLIGFDGSGEFLRADVGSIEAGGQATGQVLSPGNSEVFSWKVTANSEDQTLGKADDLSLGEMLQKILSDYPLARGEWIAVGWTDAELSKLEISPTTAQTRSSTLLLMHAKPGLLDPIEHDLRIMPKISNDPDDL